MVGLKSGLSYSLREQHQTYIDMFEEMKCIMGESSKVMIETSSSLSETLKSENKESGKTLSSLKEVLGTAHELTKTLVERLMDIYRFLLLLLANHPPKRKENLQARQNHSRPGNPRWRKGESVGHFCKKMFLNSF